MRMPASTHHPERWTAQRVRAELLDATRPTPRYELIDGELLVTPSPDNAHQRAVRELFLLVHAYVEQHGIGETLFSPSDIELAPDTIVQPDLYVMSSTSRLTRRWSTDDRLLLAVEILSPGSARHDRVKKRRFFARVGVPEYWVVDLDARVVERTRPDDERIELASQALAWHPAGAPEPLTLDLAELFRRVLGDEVTP
jgi:Uma2 family endonuclease